MTSPVDHEVFFARFYAVCRPRNGLAPAEVSPRYRSLDLHDLLGWSVRHDFATLQSRSRAKVAQPVGLAKGVFIVLHDEKGVAQIAQFSQRLQQTVVVPLVQSDGGFVEHVHHPGQPAPDLRCKTNALALASRKRVRLSVEGQVVQTDAIEEAQSPFDFPDDFVADEHASLVKGFQHVMEGFRRAIAVGGPGANQSQGVVNGALAHFRQANAAHRDVPCSSVQFFTRAIRTIEIGHACNESVAGSLRRCFGVGLLQTRDDAFPRLAVFVLRAVFGNEFVVNNG